MATKKPIIPPGGFAGLGQQTPATQQLFGRAVAKKKRRGKKRPARKRAAKKTARKRPVRARGARSNTRRKVARKKKPLKRMVKGSAAAKRHMAKLRRMRKR